MTTKYSPHGSRKSGFARFLGRHPALRVFLIAFGCCAVLFGVAAVVMTFLMASPTSGKTSASSVAPLSIPSEQTSSKTVLYSDKDSFNLLLVTYDDTTAAAQVTTDSSSGAAAVNGQPATIALVRVDSAYNRLALWQVPLEQSVLHGGTSLSAADDFRQNGINALSSDLAAKVGVSIRYMCMVPFSKLSLIMNTFSGLQYNVPSAMTYTANDLVVHQAAAGSQLLNADSAIAMLGTASYGSTSVDKYNMQASLLKAFLSSKFSGTYIANAGTVYNTALSYTQTNFYATDISSRLETLQRITSQGSDYIKVIQPTYIPVVQGNTSVFDIDQSMTGLFKTYFGGK